MPGVKGKTRYSVEGKQLIPLSDQDFKKGMDTGYFIHSRHKGLVALFYYSAVRCTEGLRATRDQFTLNREKRVIIWNVGQRLKHGKTTPPLVIPVDAPYAKYIWLSIERTQAGQRVWPYCRRTAYNIVHRCFKYPHFFRLSRITNFFLEGWTIAQVKNWTGLTLAALEFYVGQTDIQRMGESLNKQPTLQEKKPL